MDIKIDEVIATYIKLRDKKASIEAEVKERVAGINDKLKKIEAYIKTQADAQGVSSFKTTSGTAFISTTESATVGDWDSVLDYILQNEAYDLLEKRVNKTAVRAILDDTKDLPPGVNFTTRETINVRKPAVGAGD